MQRKKILFVMQLPPPIHGASVMNKLIKESSVINSEFSCDYINLATAKDISDLQKNRIGKYFITLKIVMLGFFKMAFKRYDYVYVTLFPYGPAFIKDSCMVLIARMLRLKTVLHLHTYGFKETSKRSSFREKIYKFVFKNSEVICLSELLIEDIETLYRGKVNILPNGIPQVNFENTYKETEGPVSLLFLSNLIKGKGILILLDALEILIKKGIDFKLRIVGAERDVTYTQLETLIGQKGMMDRITIAGARFGDEKHEEYRNAGIFILPSNYDTFGLVLLEAMQFGIPCISTNIGGIPDVLGNERGLIINEITATALSLALEKLIKDKELRMKMSRNAFSYFEENFTDKIFETRLKHILDGKGEIVSERLTKLK